MGKIRRKFDIEFKRRLVEQIDSGQISASAAARDYQLSPSLVDRWRKQYRNAQLNESRSSVRDRQLEAENERLKAKIGDLVMQNEHLKKLRDYVQRQKNADTSVITGQNWKRFKKAAR